MWYFCFSCLKLYSVVVRQEYSTNCPFCHRSNVQRVNLGVMEVNQNG